MKKILIAPLLIALLIYTSCTNNEASLFDKVELHLDNDHDSLIHYLKLIKQPEHLLPSQRAKFGILQSKTLGASDKNDSELEYSLNYGMETKDTLMMIEVYVTQAYHEKNSSEKQIECLEKALALAINIKNDEWIAQLYLKIGLAHENLKNDDVAFDYFLKTKEYSGTDDNLYHLAVWNMSRLYRKKEMYNEAIDCLMDVIENAKIHSPENLSSLYKQVSDIYLEQKKYDGALKYINLSISNRTNVQEAPIYNLAKGIVFVNTLELDSARMYLNYAIESPNRYVSNRALEYLSRLNNQINCFDYAYKAKIKENDNLSSLLSTENSLILEQKYMEEVLKNENNELKLEQQQQKNYLLIVSIILLVVLVLIYIFYSYKKKQQILIKYEHEEELLKEKVLLNETQNLVLKRENELAFLQQKAANLRASLFKKMSLSQKLPSLDRELSKNNDANQKINLTEQELSDLRKTVNLAYNDFSKKLADLFPSLSENDIIFCCLIKIQVDMQDLSDIYCISKAGITKRKMRIKKEKMKIQDDISLDQYIEQFN